MYRTIVVGTDGSETARDAVRHAAGLAQLTGATLHVVCARQLAPVAIAAPDVPVAAFDTSAMVDEAAADIVAEAVKDAKSLGVAVESHTPRGPAATCLVEVAKTVEADLLVVGSRGMRGARRVLGSTPNTVTHQAQCNVLVVQTH